MYQGLPASILSETKSRMISLSSSSLPLACAPDSLQVCCRETSRPSVRRRRHETPSERYHPPLNFALDVTPRLPMLLPVITEAYAVEPISHS